ncbi:MAG TPA: hypothetical protein VE944_26470 [Nostoc sp.]|uniref:hypothetical protein n=1 Tax=Nostoc sp. TaxID=1180 RepID=UPI002D531302|nr:hypothetical protein [Nostoc sp.]HYX17840.1 hypothetical protein [Nostoc sp.]
MAKYHYEIIVNLDQIDPGIGRLFFGEEGSRTAYLNTNNRLNQHEFLTISTPRGALINLEITKITRYLMEINEDNQLIEMDMSYPFHQNNRAVNTTDEMWFTCRANALMLTGD